MEIILIIAGAAFFYFLQRHIYKKYWDRGLDATLSFCESDCTEGGKGHLTEVITNKKWLPLPVVRVRFKCGKHFKFEGDENISVSDSTYKNDIFSAMFYLKITRTIEFECMLRGLYTIDEINLVSYDLFMTSPMVRSLPCNASLLVLPRGVDISRLRVPFNKMMGNLLTKRCSQEDPFEFRAIRDYSANDPMKSINWKASAKTGDLKVNVHNYTSRQEVCILVNFDSDTEFCDDSLCEESIRLANSLVTMFVGEGIVTGMITGGTDCVTGEPCSVRGGSNQGHVKTVRAALARVSYDKNANGFAQLLDSLNGTFDKNTLFILISSSTKKVLQESFMRLCGGTDGSVWIVPHKSDDNNMPALGKLVDVIGWEVV